MEDTTLKKKDIEELEKLVELAKEQGNNINLNLVYMVIDSEKIDYAKAMRYFEDRGITMIEGDVEPDITAYSCEGERIRPFDPSKISNSLGEESTNALNMGFGVSYSLPIIVALLSAREGDILVLENPEAHLHPRGQRKIGELVALAAANGVQIFMETHSDHVLNGIRLSVRNKKISSDKVKINYFYEYLSEEGIQKHEKTSPEILEDGSLSNWPEGFFDEWDKAIDELF